MTSQRDDWPQHIQVAGAGSDEQRDEALRRLRQSIRDAGYSEEDERTLLVALAANTYRAMLLVYEDGTDFWLIEMPGACPRGARGCTAPLARPVGIRVMTRSSTVPACAMTWPLSDEATWPSIIQRIAIETKRGKPKWQRIPFPSWRSLKCAQS